MGVCGLLSIRPLRLSPLRRKFADADPSMAEKRCRYGFASLAVALATGGRLLLDPLLGTQFPFATVFLAVLVAAWYGAMRPALLAAALGAVASDFFLLPPRGGFHLASFTELESEGGGNGLHVLVYLERNSQPRERTGIDT